MSKRFMIVAGETSGDTLAAELVRALKKQPQFAQAPFPPKFFGAGGSKMAEAGVELSFDLTQHAVFGFFDVFRKYLEFQRLFNQLVKVAEDRLPDVFIGVDFSGFNRRLAHALKERARAQQGPFTNWRPKFVQFVSPQVWASRPGRALQLEEDLDLLLSIVPFEKEWYAQKTPRLRVEYVGHPLVDRLKTFREKRLLLESSDCKPVVLLLPGSRRKEVSRHLEVMLAAAAHIRTQVPAEFRIILPNENLAELARPMITDSSIKVQIGGLSEALCEATMAIASSGTVTTECAYMEVPTVVLYKVSTPEYWIGKQIVTVNYIALVNLISGRGIFPEFIQQAATVENLAQASLHWLKNPEARRKVVQELQPVLATFGTGGAIHRAAQAVAALA
ncbi:MAG: lipid-A-disaccharide synthase [Verrucomicrobia bacterium]|jgi:lipid-A-disaccharide synthase|nr:lipid-A-disaccharide synthase [Verrucomicrobiota bacterium]